MPDHARLAPSAAKRWMTCPASVKREAAMLEPEQSEYAREGTAAHRILELALIAAEHPLSVPLRDTKMFAPFSGEQIQEMREGAAMAWEYVILGVRHAQE